MESFSEIMERLPPDDQDAVARILMDYVRDVRAALDEIIDRMMTVETKRQLGLDDDGWLVLNAGE